LHPAIVNVNEIPHPGASKAITAYKIAMVADPDRSGADGHLASGTIDTCVGDTTNARAAAESIAVARDVRGELNGCIYGPKGIRVSEGYGP